VNVTRNGLLAQVSAAHLISHLHIMTVPALLPLLPGVMEVGFVELGIAIGVFNIVTAMVQIPLGFMVDRIGAKRMLLAALLLGAFSFGLVAAIPTYSCLLVAMVLAGLANGVYHPADYSLLSRGMAPERMGKAFSVHTFSGFLGGALAPPVMIGVALMLEPRWAFAVAAMAGLLVCTLVMPGVGQGLPDQGTADASRVEQRPLATPLASLAILMLLFMMLNLSTGSIEQFSVSALVGGFDVSLPDANRALTVFLFSTAFGVLAGGVLADMTKRHGSLAGIAFALAACLAMVVASVPLSPLMLALVLGATGFLAGVVAPSRDMLVRAASPAGAEGRTFGIVSTGFNLGGVVGPILFGFMLDQGWYTSLFWAAAAFMGITTLIVLLQEQRRVKYLGEINLAGAN
jgi:MFS family permease